MARRLAAVLLALALAPAAHAAEGPALTVEAGADNHAISPLIYGMNFGDPSLMAELDIPLDRWGGNTTDTYNHAAGFHNTGNDYFFENIADCWDDAHGYCADPATHTFRSYRAFIEKDRAAGAATLFTLPMLGLVAKAGSARSQPLTCAWPEGTYPTQDAFDIYQAPGARCGNGRNGGAPIASTPSNTGQAWATADNDAFIDAITGEFDGLAFYELGNEPALWNDTHRDMHPAATTYEELWTKSRDLALAVRASDPGAKTVGFSEWGWPHWFCSAADDISNGCQSTDTDRAAHGGTPLVEWFLQQFADYESDNGTRLLDYLDVHYYRQGGDPFAATRSLWDPTFTDPSWIADEIELVPRMKRWVADNYPGTKLAITEYDLSAAGDEARDTLVQAEVLAIFAREGVDLAAKWPTSESESSQADAWRIHRNYDGAGSKFGDVWARSTSADQSQLAVYGARRSSDGALTVLVFNKTADELTSAVQLPGFAAGGSAQAWRSTGQSGIGRLDDVAPGAPLAFPAKSMTLLVVPPAQPAGGDPAPGDGSGTGEAPPAAGPVPVTTPGVTQVPARRCVVPRLKGRTLRAAKRLLAARRCRAGRVKRVRSRKRKGTVVAQAPAAGRRLPDLARVRLSISRGRR